MKKILMILYRDLDYDGRAARMIEVAQPLGDLTVLDATWAPLPADAPQWRKRIQLKESWGRARRHLEVLWRTVAFARKIKPDMIVAENFFSTFTGWVCARMLGVPLVYDSYELMATLPNEPAGLQFKFWAWLEKTMTPHCDLVIAANPERAEAMQKLFGLKILPESMRNIPQRKPVTQAEIDEALVLYPALRKRSLDDRIILYQGDIRYKHALGRFIPTLDYLPKNYRIVMIGKGPAVEHMAELGEKYKAEGRFDMLGRVPNLVAATPHADIGLVAYPFDMLNHVYGAPNKIYEYSMSGLPVVVSNTPTLGTITRELKHGVLFDENDTTEALARKIQEAEKITVDADDFCARIAVERDGTMADIRAKMKALFK